MTLLQRKPGLGKGALAYVVSARPGPFPHFSHLCPYTHHDPTPFLPQKTFDPGPSSRRCFLGPSPVACPDEAITVAGFGDSAFPLPLLPLQLPHLTSISQPVLTAGLQGAPIAQSPHCSCWLWTAGPWLSQLIIWAASVLLVEVPA